MLPWYHLHSLIRPSPNKCSSQSDNAGMRPGLPGSSQGRVQHEEGGGAFQPVDSTLLHHSCLLVLLKCFKVHEILIVIMQERQPCCQGVSG
jgi:hypothetical protein